MGNYNRNDITRAFKWAQKNPKSTYDDYLDFNSKNITDDELKDFEDFQYDKVILTLKDKKYEFIIIKNKITYLNLERLPQRLVGTKGHYLLTPMPGEWYNGICVLHISPNKNDIFFTISDWNSVDGIKGLYIIGNEKLKFTFEYDDKEFDELNYEKIESFKNKLSQKYYKLWDNQSRLHSFVNGDLNTFDWKPASKLFKKI